MKNNPVLMILIFISVVVMLVVINLPVHAKGMSRTPSQTATNTTNSYTTSIQPSGGTPAVIQEPQSPAASANVYDPRFPPVLPKGPVCVIHQPYGDIVRTDNFCSQANN